MYDNHYPNDYTSQGENNSLLEQAAGHIRTVIRIISRIIRQGRGQHRTILMDRAAVTRVSQAPTSTAVPIPMTMSGWITRKTRRPGRKSRILAAGTGRRHWQQYLWACFSVSLQDWGFISWMRFPACRPVQTSLLS